MRTSTQLGFALATLLSTSGAFALNSTVPMFAPAIDCSLPNVSMNCVLWEPANYDPTKKYPLIVYMHGAGQSGYSSDPAENMSRIENTQNWAAMLLKVVDEETGKTNGDYLVMMPQAPDFETTPPNGGAYVHWDWTQTQSYSLSLAESPTMKNARSMIDGVRATHSVDSDRIYAIGASMGGFGAWDAISRYPGLFAAGLPNAGGGAPDAALLLRNMAIWSHHNDGDSAVPVDSDRAMFKAIALAGGRPRFTETVSNDHTDAGVSGDPNFMSWMLAQRRGVPATSNPVLAFDPPGGALNGPVSLTISSDQTNNIRYTLDGTIPSPSNGMVYNGPINLTDSVILIAMANTGEQKIFHAAPFQIDGKPLPFGAELVDAPPAPPEPEPGNGSGGAPGGATGGAPSSGGTSSAGGSPSASGGAFGASGGATGNPGSNTGGTSSGGPTSGGTSTGGPTSGGSSSNNSGSGGSQASAGTPPARGATSRESSSGGCSLDASRTSSASLWATWAIGIGALIARRRRRALTE